MAGCQGGEKTIFKCGLILSHTGAHVEKSTYVTYVNSDPDKIYINKNCFNEIYLSI